MIEVVCVGIPRGHKDVPTLRGLVKRITSVEELKDADREAILQIVRDTLASFQNE